MRSVLPPRFALLRLGPSVLQAASGVKCSDIARDVSQPQAGIHGASIADAANG